MGLFLSDNGNLQNRQQLLVGHCDGHCDGHCWALWWRFPTKLLCITNPASTISSASLIQITSFKFYTGFLMSCEMSFVTSFTFCTGLQWLSSRLSRLVQVWIALTMITLTSFFISLQEFIAEYRVWRKYCISSITSVFVGGHVAAAVHGPPLSPQVQCCRCA